MFIRTIASVPALETLLGIIMEEELAKVSIHRVPVALTFMTNSRSIRSLLRSSVVAESRKISRLSHNLLASRTSLVSGEVLQVQLAEEILRMSLQ